MVLLINAVAEGIKENCFMLVHAITKMAPKVRYSTEERIFIVKNSYLCGENATLLLRKWAITFKKRPKPSRTMISDITRKFEMLGTWIVLWV